MGEYVITNELYHHGILGQKWGVRRYQNPDGTLTTAGKRRYGSVEALNKHQDYKKARLETNRSFNKMYNQASNRPIYTNFTKKGKSEFDKKLDDYDNKLKKETKAKKSYHDSLREAKNNQVKEYSKQYEKASKLQEEADNLYISARSQYRELGSNRVKRVMASIKNETVEAKRYNKTYEKASDLDDKAYEEWNKARAMYSNIGRNQIDRIIVNAKYDRQRFK